MTHRVLRILLILVVAALAAAPLWADRADLRLLMEVLSYLALAQMWNLLAGYTGLISVGQQAYVGLGGYVFFALTILGGIPVIVAFPLTAILVAALAIPTGWVAFRLNGAYFAIGTWVIAEIYRLLAAQMGSLGGGSGISLPIAVVKSIASSRMGREYVMYYIAFTLAVVAVFGVWILLRSRWGLALTAIRDSEVAAESVGVNTCQSKYFIYVLTAALTGFTGAFIFFQKLRITPEAAFSVNDWTAFVIFIVVIGGIGTIEGPIIGVVLFFVMREVAADAGTWYLIMLGAIAILVMLIDKRGIWGAISARYKINILPTARRMKGDT